MIYTVKRTNVSTLDIRDTFIFKYFLEVKKIRQNWTFVYNNHLQAAAEADNNLANINQQ